MTSELPNAGASGSKSMPGVHASQYDDTSLKPEGLSDSRGRGPIPELFDPFKHGIPKPEGDPYNYFLKPMLEKDAIQCDAWKDEVQNILIFAGLFSAVVTAFIIESYQRLQPDPNDAILSLLSHIAETLDGVPPNETMPISPPSMISSIFTPSRSDININIFWFISLVLSLTVALIGIITLQWLREHQRYDNNLPPRETFALLNLRLQSLKRWYVPQIFAGLPLLLQGALILFFAGIIEFLFALRREVAVPVTLSVCIPLIFLVSTTLLPVLQIYVIQDPFRLAVNEEIPSPCPYKSPQSIISRRISTFSPVIFKGCASIISGAYTWIIATILFPNQLMGHRTPIFRSNPNRFKAMVTEPLSVKVERLWHASGEWMAIDRLWLEVRTSYTVLLQTGLTREDRALSRTNPMELQLCPDVYDCVEGLHSVMGRERSEADDGAIYHCLEALSLGHIKLWTPWLSLSMFEEGVSSVIADLCFAFGLIFQSEDWFPSHFPLPVSFIKDILAHQQTSTQGEDLLKAIFMNICSSGTFPRASPQIIKAFWNEINSQLLMQRLQIGPERIIIQMKDGDSWLPTWILHFMEICGFDDRCSRATSLFCKFLEKCSKIQLGNLSSPLPLRAAPAKESYAALAQYVDAVALVQVPETVVETLEFLAQLRRHSNNQLQEQPFLLVTLCLYLDAVIRRGWIVEELVELQNWLSSICQVDHRGMRCWEGWEQLDNAINYIYEFHYPDHPKLPLINNGHDMPNVSNRAWYHRISRKINSSQYFGTNQLPR